MSIDNIYDVELIEANKKIALFMGFAEEDIQAEEWCGCNVLLEDKFSETGKTWTAVRYHDSWDWLMTVLEKIKTVPFEDGDKAFIRTFQGNMVRINRYALYEEETKLKSAFMAATDFISSLPATLSEYNEYKNKGK